MTQAAFALSWSAHGHWVLLAFSLFTVAVHGRQELAGWWGKRAWWAFAAAQTLFVALAVVGFVYYPPVLWALAAFKVADGVGFHVVFFPQWPGRETLLLPLADAAFITLWLAA